MLIMLSLFLKVRKPLGMAECTQENDLLGKSTFMCDFMKRVECPHVFFNLKNNRAEN